jgi:hypothetical protein
VNAHVNIEAQTPAAFKRPVMLRVLGDEVRQLDSWVKEDRLSPFEAEARLDAWKLKAPPNWYRYEKFAATGVWEPVPEREREYRTPKATEDAFFGVVVRQDKAAQERWLKQHPKDADHLMKLWEAKRCATQGT